MKTHCGLKYSSKIKATIINTINEAKENIFSNYFFIVDDPLFLKKLFLNTLIHCSTFKLLIIKI